MNDDDWFDHLTESKKELVREYGERLVRDMLRRLPGCSDEELARFLQIDRDKRQDAR